MNNFYFTKFNTIKRRFIIFMLLLISISVVSCSDKVKPEPEPTPLPMRSMQAELDFVKSKANTLSKNSDDYREANFGNSITMIYVPAGSLTMGNNALSPDVVQESYPASPEHTVSLNHY